MGEKTAMQSKAVKLIYVSSVMLSIECVSVGGSLISVSLTCSEVICTDMPCIVCRLINFTSFCFSFLHFWRLTLRCEHVSLALEMGKGDFGIEIL